MTGGRVRRFMRNLVGYAMGDPWEGQQPTDPGDSPSGSAQGHHASYGQYHQTASHVQPGHHDEHNAYQEYSPPHFRPHDQQTAGDGSPTSSGPGDAGFYQPEHTPQNLSSFHFMPKPQHDYRKQDPSGTRPSTSANQPYSQGQQSPRSGEKHPRDTATAVPSGPVLVETAARNGGIQGFRWYANGLLKDCDGDVACSFLEESPKGLPYSAPFSRRGSGSVHPITSASGGWGSFSKATEKVEGQSPMTEVSKVHLQPMEHCPVVSCVGGNLAHALGPSREMVFA